MVEGLKSEILLLKKKKEWGGGLCFLSHCHPTKHTNDSLLFQLPQRGLHSYNNTNYFLLILQFSIQLCFEHEMMQGENRYPSIAL